MSNAADFLVEIGTEELPPKALRNLMNAFAGSLQLALDNARLEHASVSAYASPRRLAVIVASLGFAQADEEVVVRGPPVSVAYDDAGKITPAGRAFAKKCGVEPEALDRLPADQGERLCFRSLERGQKAAALIPGLVETALKDLPIPRRMRWGDGEAEFVRPVHWIVLLHGSHVVEGSVMSVPAGRMTRGHRFHAPGEIALDKPAKYLSLLKKARVLADFDVRRKTIVTAVKNAAKEAGGEPVASEALYDEVTALTEWPVPLIGSFDKSFLSLPKEVIVATLSSHQRYFPIADKGDDLLPRFITIANLVSKAPDRVRDGNERVIRSRLADAAFFWESDKRVSLADRRDALRDVVYQRGLGSIHDKSVRVAKLAVTIGSQVGVETGAIVRAAALAKCDLLTGMVGEFPELQGLMGRYYAAADGEPGAVAEAIGAQYLPRFAGDALPQTVAGQALAIADKLDTIAGIFAVGKMPSGNRDPFGLRRSALGVVRIIIEQGLDLDITALVAATVADQPVRDKDEKGLSESLYNFVTERMRAYYLDRKTGLTTEMFAAVMAKRPVSLLDFDARLKAVAAFVKLEPASSLAAANKRISNILKQAGVDKGASIDQSLITEPAETALFESVVKAQKAVAPLMESRDYTNVLTTLAALRDPVDGFFDDVMVMTDDAALRNNRLALLAELRAMFLDVADVSRLSISQESAR
ncbi:MAG: glycine--tRNA ligase subunit beta [Proteobacteria bacterium]|nr:glycine--tRNA ligase subunit beta [Pseudomonadota bacterium]